MKKIDSAEDTQEIYEGLHYLQASIAYRKGAPDELIAEWIKEFALTIPLYEHVKARNGEAVKLLEETAKLGNVIRII
ncbi:hypothetical protein FJZ48_04260 [Candidatus Uhrbacteria bacterium]|nr:hypothetical protein [Candidatus Uhrbacteria bacterium]